ncbi:hypothetical protein AB0J90_26505 [Micromonospora sp. NPDC049523]|uniref:hypothetical protein n=1 Tax=Micromonospora sp. NPDC049523 TaxID=3155921 RepID=UPI0034436545
MIALVRSDLYRTATVRSGWLSIAFLCVVTMMLGWVSVDMWELLAGLGAVGLASVRTAQH